MERALLHVGPHKTGTTYLQVCFARGREALAARGIVVPEIWENTKGNPSHTGLVQAMQDEAGLAQARAVLDPLRSQGHTLLVSAEDLITLRPEPIRRLGALLAGLQVTPVYYVRRWSELLPSAWQETIKHGKTWPLPDFVRQHADDPRKSKRINIASRLRGYAQQFGPASLRLVSHSLLRDEGIDVFQHFAAHFLNWPDATPPPLDAEVNASRDFAAVELLRRLNICALDRGDLADTSLRVRLDRAWPDLDTEPVLQALRARPSSLVIDDSEPPFAPWHAQMFERFRSRLVPPALPDRFLEPKKREIAYVEDRVWTDRGLAAAADRLYREVAALPRPARHPVSAGTKPAESPRQSAPPPALP